MATATDKNIENEMPERIEWEIFPARNPKKVAIALGITLPFLAFVYVTSGFYWTLFSAIILAASLAQFWTVTRYTLDEEGVTIKRPLYTIRKPWSHYRRWEVDRNGVFLSPFKKPSRIDAYRGNYLIFGDVDRDKVVAFVRRMMERKSSQNPDN